MIEVFAKIMVVIVVILVVLVALLLVVDALVIVVIAAIVAVIAVFAKNKGSEFKVFYIEKRSFFLIFTKFLNLY